MFNFEGGIVDETRRHQQPMLLLERKEDMYELSHVTDNDWNKNININLLSVFVADIMMMQLTSWIELFPMH